ncbi:MAG TPA: hypothetical protein VK421_04330 [Pyrinomonadaceae bacterium]|nr:hypothetical protein [Pyrinomonadaceae bacterium]
MLCREFEDGLSDHLDGTLPPDAGRSCAAHALRCAACRDLLGAIKATLRACRASAPPAPSRDLEARILQQTPGRILQFNARDLSTAARFRAPPR